MRTHADQDTMGERSSSRPADGAAAALFAALFEASPDGLLLIDGDGVVRGANRALSSMMGIEPEQSVGTEIASFLPDVAAAVFRLDQCPTEAPGDEGVGPSFAYDADGEAFPVDVEITSVETAEGRFSLALIRDLSVRRETAVTLLHAEQDLREARRTHDEVIQQVFAAGMMLRAAMSLAVVDGVREHISTATAGLDATIDDLRLAIDRLGGLDAT